jgi:TorA maturation chaperone TorD
VTAKVNPSANSSLTASATAALARSVLWQAISLGFRPPTALTRARLGSREALEPLAAAAAAIDPSLVAPVLGLSAAPGPDGSRFGRLFGHTSRGEVPPYETEWGKDELFFKPHELADLHGILDAFGLKLERSEHERVDHVSVETELLAYLAAREARAIESGDAGAAEAATRAQAIVLGDHLGRFAAGFARLLSGHDEEGFYGGLGRVLAALVRVECARLAVTPGDATLAQRPTDLDEQPVDCGPGTDLIQLRGATPPQGPLCG